MLAVAALGAVLALFALSRRAAQPASLLQGARHVGRLPADCSVCSFLPWLSDHELLVVHQNGAYSEFARFDLSNSTLAPLTKLNKAAHQHVGFNCPDGSLLAPCVSADGRWMMGDIDDNRVAPPGTGMDITVYRIADGAKRKLHIKSGLTLPLWMSDSRHIALYDGGHVRIYDLQNPRNAPRELPVVGAAPQGNGKTTCTAIVTPDERLFMMGDDAKTPPTHWIATIDLRATPLRVQTHSYVPPHNRSWRLFLPADASSVIWAAPSDNLSLSQTVGFFTSSSLMRQDDVWLGGPDGQHIRAYQLPGIFGMDYVGLFYSRDGRSLYMIRDGEIVTRPVPAH